MSITKDARQYGEMAAEQGRQALAEVRKGVYAAVGAGDALVTRATERGQALATRTQEWAETVANPAEVRARVSTLAQNAGGQAAEAYATLSARGAEVVQELRQDPRVQRVILRTERGVDVVEDTLENLLDDAAGQLDAAAAGTRQAEDAVAEGAGKTRTTVRRSAAGTRRARTGPGRTTPDGAVPAGEVPDSAARDTAARTTAAKASGAEVPPPVQTPAMKAAAATAATQAAMAEADAVKAIAAKDTAARATEG